MAEISPQSIDATLVIQGARILDPAAPVAHPPHRDIWIARDRIAALLEPGVQQPRPDTPMLDGSGLLAIPGFVSAHYHSHDALLRGCFKPMPVEEWFMYGVPAAFPPRSQEELRVRTLMGALDALKGGITTLQDMMSFYPYDARCVATALDAYDEIGIRCVFAMQVADAPGVRGTCRFSTRWFRRN